MGQIVTVFPDQPSVRQSLTLGTPPDAAQFSLRLTWRDRTAAWYADLWTASGAPVWLGQRVTPGFALGFGLTPEGAPPGVLLVRGPSDYERGDLGRTVQIVYYPPDELPEATPGANPLTVTVP